ncbi:flagellar motor protein MotP [Aquibacillus albus]|uniref:Chemotaxis protein MotA n=1 Tax=Aquibacillus albus TaxID=1168171 RepID=A0ABS2N3X1_9BACI|nr:flagellar motor protein MotP [Aquibacillus albus]MBM7572842.1 chemotaxis protein MotA [Aquibacillus albus]
MKKRDLLTPIGITFGFLMLMFGILTSGGTSEAVSFVQLTSVLIVLGGIISGILINFNLDHIKATRFVLAQAFTRNEQSLPILIDLFVRLSERARREGLLALENELDNVEDPFIRKGVLLAIDGVEPEVINDIMTAEIIAMEERHQTGRAILEKAGEYAPAWGMIGTLIGLVLMLNNLTDPSTLGPNMAVALLTTLYGTVLSNLVFIPMAAKLEMKSNEEVFLKQIAIEGVIGVQSGQNPRILNEKLSAFLSGDMKRKNEDELDAEYMGESVNEA